MIEGRKEISAREDAVPATQPGNPVADLKTVAPF